MYKQTTITLIYTLKNEGRIVLVVLLISKHGASLCIKQSKFSMDLILFSLDLVLNYHEINLNSRLKYNYMGEYKKKLKRKE
jgi:hypothetical protein